MAEKLLTIYKEISTLQGIKGKMELAKKTKIPSTKASMEPDSQENISKFREAYKELTGAYPTVV